ncbi:MAG TPA: hypothetical protein VHJ38_02360 [Nitrososphaeraceae archaeon]|jgi:hypothetical protein|nr:hypothetical protein [Nitrososphaeraceae archaeon]
MTFNDNQMLILSFEALNATIAEFRDARDQLENTFERIGEDTLVRSNADFYIGCVIGGIRANFRCIARQQGFSTNDINAALPYVSNYIVSNISMIMEAVASK